MKSVYGDEESAEKRQTKRCPNGPNEWTGIIQCMCAQQYIETKSNLLEEAYT